MAKGKSSQKATAASNKGLSKKSSTPSPSPSRKAVTTSKKSASSSPRRVVDHPSKPPAKYNFAESVVASEVDIAKVNQEIASLIAKDYAGKISPTSPLIVLGVLKGSFIFMADLCRALVDHQVPILPEFLCVSSYGAAAKSSGEVRMLLDSRQSITNRHVLIVEDIVESGRTLNFLSQVLHCRSPASLKIATLLDKPNKRAVPCKVDYVGFQLEEGFLVGYGLDWNEQFRTLRDVVILKPEVYEVAPHHAEQAAKAKSKK